MRAIAVQVGPFQVPASVDLSRDLAPLTSVAGRLEVFLPPLAPGPGIAHFHSRNLLARASLASPVKLA